MFGVGLLRTQVLLHLIQGLGHGLASLLKCGNLLCHAGQVLILRYAVIDLRPSSMTIFSCQHCKGNLKPTGHDIIQVSKGCKALMCSQTCKAAAVRLRDDNACRTAISHGSKGICILHTTKACPSRLLLKPTRHGHSKK